jgi:hypothetical protein
MIIQKMKYKNIINHKKSTKKEYKIFILNNVKILLIKVTFKILLKNIIVLDPKIRILIKIKMINYIFIKDLQYGNFNQKEDKIII